MAPCPVAAISGTFLAASLEFPQAEARGQWGGREEGAGEATHTRVSGVASGGSRAPPRRALGAARCALRSVLAVYACAAARHAPHSSPTPARPGTNQRALRLGEAGERHWWFLTTPCKMTNFMFKAVQDA